MPLRTDALDPDLDLDLDRWEVEDMGQHLDLQFSMDARTQSWTALWVTGPDMPRWELRLLPLRMTVQQSDDKRWCSGFVPKKR